MGDIKRCYTQSSVYAMQIGYVLDIPSPQISPVAYFFVYSLSNDSNGLVVNEESNGGS